MPEKVVMPQLGESVVEGTVTKWLIKEGEPIKNMEALLEVSTDKVDTEIPSPADGTLLKILVPDGQTVKAGALLAWIGKPGEPLPEEAPGTGKAAAPITTPAKDTVTAAPPETAKGAGRKADLGFISPVVARLARENNLDLALVRGTGEGGRITKKDVLAYLEQKPAARTVEAAAWETPGEGDLFRPTEMMFPKSVPEPAVALPDAPTRPTAGSLIPFTTVRKTIAARMVASVQTAPHVTTVMEADLSRVAAHRQTHKTEFERASVHLTYTAYFITAIIRALKTHPAVNSSWTDEGIRLHGEINIGMAVSLGEEGLIVPVIKSAENLSLLGLARSINDLSARARARSLKPDEVQGATFTLTNHGTGGSLFATPIISQPQCAILGVGAVQKRAVVVNDAIAIRPMAYLSLTFDHRILDGAGADGFLAAVDDCLENWV
jgi:2-oxoglutarate dehydrogenase E2 component (dihydrolipoamide succinyltransferase)